MRDRLQPSEPTVDSAWNVSHELPRHLEDAIEAMRACDPAKEVLGEQFVNAFCAVKELEYATYNRVISSWEREHLLLLV
jgi:glutamine synthetase